MCKVLVIPKITNKTRDNALKFFEIMKKAMSEYNKDGLGYAAIDSKGNLFGERFHINSDGFEKNVIDNPMEDVLKGLYSGTKDTKPSGNVNSFGTVNMADVSAITLHTRMATSGRSFENTHPFVYEDADTSLIHNGIIRNTEDFKFKVSTCDSESILISYLDSQVNTKGLKNANDMAKKLKGYYAAAMFSRDSEGNRILDIFKCNANLHAAYIKELDSLVFTTSDVDLDQICAYLKFSKSKTYTMKDGISMRYQNGEMIGSDSFIESSQYNYVEKTYENNSYSYPNYLRAAKKNLTKEEVDYFKLPPGIKAVV